MEHSQAVLDAAMQEGRLPEERREHYRRRLSKARLLEDAEAIRLKVGDPYDLADEQDEDARAQGSQTEEGR